MWKSVVLKDVDRLDTSPVVKLSSKVSRHAITLIRQSLDEYNSSYLCYDREILVMERHWSFNNCISII